MEPIIKVPTVRSAPCKIPIMKTAPFKVPKNSPHQGLHGTNRLFQDPHRQNCPRAHEGGGGGGGAFPPAPTNKCPSSPPPPTAETPQGDRCQSALYVAHPLGLANSAGGPGSTSAAVCWDAVLTPCGALWGTPIPHYLGWRPSPACVAFVRRTALRGRGCCGASRTYRRAFWWRTRPSGPGGPCPSGRHSGPSWSSGLMSCPTLRLRWARRALRPLLPLLSLRVPQQPPLRSLLP